MRAEGPPPQRLSAFFRWCLKGAWPIIWLSLFASVLVGFGEVLAAFFIGWIIDMAMDQEDFTGFHATPFQEVDEIF